MAGPGTDDDTGRVVILNGTSRSGKTTLAAGFRDRRALSGDPWVVFGVDDFVTKLALPFIGFDRPPPATADELAEIEGVGRFAHEGVHFTATSPTTTDLVFGPTGDALIRSFHDAVAAAASNGLSVVVDDVVLSQAHWDHWHAALDGFDIVWVRVVCADAARRSAELGDRTPGMVEAQTPLVHSFGDHEHTIDTVALDEDGAVDELIRLLDTRVPPTGVRRGRAPAVSGSLADHVAGLDGGERWTPTSSIAVDGDVGHPQGLVPWGDGWLVTTVHLDPVRGEVLVVEPDGVIAARLDVTDGPRIHPGGVAVHDHTCVVAVAEYRPDSTTLLRRIDAALDVTDLGRVDDHLGAVCELDDGTLLAVTWGSRDLLRLDAEGRVLDRRPNPSLFVDHQDLTFAGPSTVVATGVGTGAGPDGSLQLGGFAVIDVDELSIARTGPVRAWMPSGRVATYNGAHLSAIDDGVELACIVDDNEASIARWTTVCDQIVD